MRWLLWLMLLPWVAGAESLAIPPGAGETSDCLECHAKEQDEFQQSRMALAAHSADFINEWSSKGRPGRCLDCHAPSGGEGVVCVDCHGNLGHPYRKLSTPVVCARCHDAPGEITVRSFFNSPASRRGEDCLDCHQQGEGFSHDFIGPTRADFLLGVARLHLSLRREGGGDTLLVRIHHRAGHSLPGGTTGRSVWLQVETFGEGEQPLTRRLFRFGWYHDPIAGWRDETLAAGPGKVIEIPLESSVRSRSIRAKLIYRFRPGTLDKPDPQAVLLDHAVFALPAALGDSR